MISPRLFRQSTNLDPYDPTIDVPQAAYREISGDLPSTGVPIALRAWVLVFDGAPRSLVRYRYIENLLNNVGADGLISVPIEGITGDRFGNMSARTDLLGEIATIWVTATADGSDARGAVLAGLNGEAVHLVSLDPYAAAGGDRAVYLLETIAMNMAARQSELLRTAADDTMSRLPLVDDAADRLDNAMVGVSWYRARRQNAE